MYPGTWVYPRCPCNSADWNPGCADRFTLGGGCAGRFDRRNPFLWSGAGRLSNCAVHGLFRWVAGRTGFADLATADFFAGFFAFPVMVARPALAGYWYHDPGDCFYPV